MVTPGTKKSLESLGNVYNIGDNFTIGHETFYIGYKLEYVTVDNVEQFGTETINDTYDFGVYRNNVLLTDNNISVL